MPSAEPGIHRIEVTTLGDLLDLRAAELGRAPGHGLPRPPGHVRRPGPNGPSFFARGLLAAGVEPGETVGILLPNCADAIAALFGAGQGRPDWSRSTPGIRAWSWPISSGTSRMRLLFISPPSPAAPDFPGLLSAAFPALSGQDRTALALDDAPDLRQVVVLGESAPPGSPPRPTSPRPGSACQTATCSAAASWSRSATPPWSCTPPAPRPSRRARCSATRP